MMSKFSKLRVFYVKPVKIPILRPFLPLNRWEITKLCIFWKLPLYIDTSNKLTHFRRNRLRLQILPTLKIFFNPKIDTALTRFIEIINSENSYFYYQLKDFKKFFQIQSFNTKGLKKNRKPYWSLYLPDVIKRKLYKQLLESDFRQLTFNEIEFLLNLKRSILK